MSRRYALAFVALVLVQFCAVYTWQQYDNNEAMKALRMSLAEIHETAIADQERLLNNNIKGFEELMTDRSKARFAPLHHFVTTQHDAYQSLTERQGKGAFREESRTFIEAVVQRYSVMMLKEHSDFDLDVDEAEIRIASNSVLATEARRDITNIPHNIGPTLQQQMAKMITLSYLQNVLIDAMSICGGRALICDRFFPVFSPDRCAYGRGDSVNAKVSIGSYSNSLDPADVKLTVNGKKLTIGPDGVADFTAPAGKRGEHTLKTKVVVTNPLTGEVQIGEGRFIYRVD